MAKNDDIQELANLCRSHHVVAAGMVGYLTATMSDQEVREALEYAQELRTAWMPGDGHLALVRERYGPLAGSQ